MAASAAAAAACQSQKYVPKVPLPSEQARNRVADLFSKYFLRDLKVEPNEKNLASREWCAVKLIEISELQLEKPESCDRAIETSHIAQFLLNETNRPESWPTWSEVKEQYNVLGHSAEVKKGLNCAAVLQLEEALELGGLVESDRDLNIVLAREQLATLAGLYDRVISLTAMEALCSILAHDLGSKEEPERLIAVLRAIMEIMKRDKSALKPSKAQKCIEVCALILDKLILMYTQGHAFAQDYHDKYELWNLIEYFQHLNGMGNPDVAAWGAFALERLKNLKAPVSLVQVLSKAEELLKKAAITGASIHQAAASDAAHYAKDTGVEVVKWVAKARYLAPEHFWAESLEEILSKLEEAKKSTSILESIQEQMAKTLEKDPSHSFAYYCVQILTEVILESADKEVQSQAFCHKDLLSLSSIFGHVYENMTGKIINPSGRLGKALSKLRSKLPNCKKRKDIWASPRLILSVAFALQKLEALNNPFIQGDVANYKRDLEERVKNQEDSSLQIIYENRHKRADLQKGHCELLNLALGEILKSIEAASSVVDADQPSPSKETPPESSSNTASNINPHVNEILSKWKWVIGGGGLLSIMGAATYFWNNWNNKISDEQEPIIEPSPPLLTEVPKKRTPTHAELNAQKAFPLPAKKSVEVPREGLLKHIQSSFNRKSTVVAHGIAGAGKTRLAEAYAREQAETRHVYWIDAKGGENLLSEYTQLALKLELLTEEDLKGPRGQENAIDEVKNYFSSHPDTFLVLDDVTSEKHLYLETDSGKISFIPEGKAKVLVTHVLITSQSDLFSDAELIEVERLQQDEAVELLRMTIKQEAPEDLLLELAERLYFHPLLIDMTGCYIQQMALRRRSATIDEIILEEVEELKASSKHLPKGHKEKIEEEVKRRWDINYLRAFEENKRINPVLGVSAYLGSNNIPLEWFGEGFRDCFDTLEGFGFCNINLQGASVSMHPLVQKLTRRKDEKNQALLLAANLVNETWIYNGESYRIPSKTKEHATHVEAVVHYAKEANIKTKKAAELMRRLGDFKEAIGQYRAAQKFYEDSLRILEAISEEDVYSNKFSLLNSLGVNALEQGNLVSAKRHLKRARLMVKGLKHEGSFNVNMAVVTFHLAEVAYAEGDYTQAVEDFKRALELVEQFTEGENPDQYRVYMLHSLGKANIELGNYSSANDYFERSNALFEKLYGIDFPHPFRARLLMNFAAIAFREGRRAEGEKLLEQAQKMMKELYGNESPHKDKISALMNLGASAFYRSRHELAKIGNLIDFPVIESISGGGFAQQDKTFAVRKFEPVYSKREELIRSEQHSFEALEMLDKLFGKDTAHPRKAQLLQNFGSIASERGDFAGAMKLYEQALEMMESIYGEDVAHPDKATVIAYIGTAALNMGNSCYAKVRLEEALSMINSLSKKGLQHKDEIFVTINLGVVAMGSSKIALAEDYFSKASVLISEQCKEDSPCESRYKLFSNLGFLALHKEEIPQAVGYFEQALSEAEKSCRKGFTCPDTHKVLNSLGQIAQCQSRIAQAKCYYKLAFVEVEKQYGRGAEHKDKDPIIKNLREVSSIQKNPTLAKKYGLEDKEVTKSEFGGSYYIPSGVVGDIGIAYIAAFREAKIPAVAIQKELGIRIRNGEVSDEDISLILTSLGLIALKKRELKSDLDEIIQRLEGVLKIGSDKASRLRSALLLSYEGIVALKKNEKISALQNFEEVLALLVEQQNENYAQLFSNLSRREMITELKCELAVIRELVCAELASSTSSKPSEGSRDRFEKNDIPPEILDRIRRKTPGIKPHDLFLAANSLYRNFEGMLSLLLNSSHSMRLDILSYLMFSPSVLSGFGAANLNSIISGVFEECTEPFATLPSNSTESLV